MTEPAAYGLWPLVIVNSIVFIIFAFSFTKPKTSRDWRSFGAFSAFIVALFTEMYGVPFTIYFLSGWLSVKFPEVNWFSHDAGHLPEMLLGWGGNPHFGPFHIISSILIFGGMWLLIRSWDVLYRAQRNRQLATEGPYAVIRHPQYVAFILIMLGFLFQWPTILTVVMFPILAWMYTRLARSEEQESKQTFGNHWELYAKRTPAFWPWGKGAAPTTRRTSR